MRDYTVDWPYEPGDLVESFDDKTNKAVNRYLIVKPVGVYYAPTHNKYAYSVLVLMHEYETQVLPFRDAEDFHGMSQNFLLAYEDSSIILYERVIKSF
jgi:hypothetical protein